MKTAIAERPNRLPWPPLLYLSPLLAAWVLQSLWPATALLAGLGAWLRVVGVALALTGITLDFAAMRTMRSARTTVLPHRGAQHLLTGGVFSFSRNPIYLGACRTLVVESGIRLCEDRFLTICRPIVILWDKNRREYGPHRRIRRPAGQSPTDT